MELFKWLFGIVVLICGSSAQNYWMQPPVQKPQLPPFQNPQQMSKVPPPAAPLDKCHVEEEEKIHCGSLETTAEQCEAISCCFDGRRCYYGKAGMVLFKKLISSVLSSAAVTGLFSLSDCAVYQGWSVCGGCGQRCHSAAH